MTKLIKHYGAFVLAGGGAFVINSILLLLLVNILRLDPYLSQAFAVACGIVYSWFINRKYTFEVPEKPSFREFIKYCGTMFVSTLVNYSVYSLSITFFAVFYMYPVLALIPATAISMIVSYLGMKFHTFR
ncbi:GtrA family protein [Curvivirga sp.]|uniref:GtrA family protein n=1 Tax=Curvivirga sp. TaxID=2856848 RepID=UPI003B59D9F9